MYGTVGGMLNAECMEQWVECWVYGTVDGMLGVWNSGWNAGCMEQWVECWVYGTAGGMLGVWNYIVSPHFVP